MDQVIINTDQSSKRLIILVSLLTSLCVTLVFNLLSFGFPSKAYTPPATNNPVPTTASVSPVSVSCVSPGSYQFLLTVNGTNFVDGAIIGASANQNGPYAPLQTRYVSATQLTSTISAFNTGSVSCPRDIYIKVSNPTPGGGISNNSQVFHFLNTNPLPTINQPNVNPAGLVPSSGSSSTVTKVRVNNTDYFLLTVNGTNFVRGSVVSFNGTNRSTTFVSPTQITALIPVSSVAAAGTYRVIVTNPSPGGGTFGFAEFTVPSYPVPTIGNIMPASAVVNNQTQITINGTGFISDVSIVRSTGFLDIDRATMFVSPTQLTALIPARSTAGPITITVFNPTPGGGTSNGVAFTFNP